MLTTLVLAGAMLASPQTADKWDIKTGLAPKASAMYDVTTGVMMAGEPHTANFKLGIELKDTPAGKPLTAVFSMKDLTTDSGQALPDNSWNATLDMEGAIVDSDAQEGPEAIRQFLTPWVFVYPTAPVGVGDTWTDTVKLGADKTDRSIVFNMKADSMEKVGGVDALKVTEDLTQSGDAGLKSTGTWWVDKSGKVLKFDIKTNNWVVPMVGDQPMDATFTGTLAKAG